MRLFRIVAVLTLAVLVAGCGLVADGVNWVRTIQLPPGKLYQPDFYKSATPEEVKKVIGGRSLHNELVREKLFTRAPRGFLSEQIANLIDIFWPGSRVSEGPPLSPLQVAAQYTPYPEVITILLDAGAEPSPPVHPPHPASPLLDAARKKFPVGVGGLDPSSAMLAAAVQKNNEVTKALLKRVPVPKKDWPWILEIFAQNGNRAMVEYCLGLPGVTVNADGRPLLAALKNRHNDLAAYLLKRGVRWPEDAGTRWLWLFFILESRNIEGFWMVVNLGLDGSRVSDSLMDDAERLGIRDEAVIRHLADTVPVDGYNGVKSVQAACYMDNVDAVRRLLMRGAAPVENDRIFISNSPHAAELEPMLLERGFRVH